MDLGRRLRELAERYFPLWCALVGALLAAPSLGAGLLTEDRLHRAAVELGEVTPLAPNLFGYWREQAPGVGYAAKDLGDMPWFALDDMRSSFWRPLSSLTTWVDYRYWPDAPWAAHLQSLLWYGLLVFSVGALYRRIAATERPPTPLWAAALACLLFAVDDAHGQPVGWLANRNAVQAALGAVLTLVAHHAWRRDGARWGAVLGPLALALGLLSGELAVGAWGYLLAYALFLDRARWHRRLLALVPFVAVTLGWAVAYRALGHGTYGSGLHIDPVAQPLAALGEATWRLPALILSLIAWPPAGAWLSHWLERRWLVGPVALLAVGLVFLALWPVLRRSPALRFYGLGALLSFGPVASTFPQDRLVLLAGVGFFPCVPALWAAAWTGAAAGVGQGVEAGAETTGRAAASRRPAWARPWRALAVAVSAGWLLVHALVAPLRLPGQSLALVPFAAAIQRAQEGLFPPGFSPTQGVVVVHSPSYFAAAFPRYMQTLEATPPSKVRVLYGGEGPASLERLDARSAPRARRPDQMLRLRAPNGLATNIFDQLYRANFRPIEPGYRVQLEGVRVEVEAVTADGRASQVLFEFSRPLESGFLRWVGWRDGTFVPFVLPRPGERVELPLMEVFP